MRHLVPGVAQALDRLGMGLMETVGLTRAEIGGVLSGRRLAIDGLGAEDEWLGHPIPDIDPYLARAGLLRRYLRCYGPSTRGAFAARVGIHAGDTDPWWSLVEDELTQVEFGGASWLLTEDLDALRSAQIPEGVRLLPPRDPYTAPLRGAMSVDVEFDTH